MKRYKSTSKRTWEYSVNCKTHGGFRPAIVSASSNPRDKNNNHPIAYICDYYSNNVSHRIEGSIQVYMRDGEERPTFGNYWSYQGYNHRSDGPASRDQNTPGSLEWEHGWWLYGIQLTEVYKSV